MFCEYCHGKLANVHMVRIINGEKNELHLCSECARKENKSVGRLKISAPSFHSLFNGSLFRIFPREGAFSSYEVASALTDDFSSLQKNGEHGILGGESYESFRDNLRAVCKHGINKKTSTESNSKDGLLLQLEQKLAESIEKENFEEAAKIRDKIKAYKNKKSQE